MTESRGAVVTDADETNKARILRAAERLFAERGIDAVSLRAVMAEAGTNVASAHYHFGSKDGLVHAIITGRSSDISSRRSAMLDALEAADTLGARELADAFVVPVAETADAGGEAWVRFISMLSKGSHPAMETVSRGFFAQGRRFIALTERLHPQWSPARVRFRLSQAMTVTFDVLGDLAGVQRTLSLSETRLSREQVVEELTGMVTAILDD